MDLLTSLHVFVRVAETGSFSAVARERGVTQPAISRQIAALEEHLGSRLVHRTTRAVGLTEDGRDFLGPAQTVLQSLEDAEGTVGSRHAGIGGLVRVSSSVVFGRVIIAPRVHLLLERHPALSIDLVLDDPARDLVHDGIDVAVRSGTLPTDSSYVTRRIGQFSEIIVGAPSYLDAHPALERPEDLAGHHCIIDDRAVQRDMWMLHGPDGPIDIHVSGRFRTDSSDAKREAAVAGLGLATVSELLVRKELRLGLLRSVLPAWKFAPVPIHAIYPSRRNLAPRIRVVLDFLVEQFTGDQVFTDLSRP